MRRVFAAILVVVSACSSAAPTAEHNSSTSLVTTAKVAATTVANATTSSPSSTTGTVPQAKLVISHVPLDVFAVSQVVATPAGLWVLAWAGQVPGSAKQPLVPSDRVLLRVDPATGQTLARFPLPTTSLRIKTSDHAIWVLAYAGNGHAGDSGTVDILIDRIDPRTGTVIEAARFAPYPSILDFAATDDALWAIYEDGIRRVDPATRRIVVDLALAGSPSAVVLGRGGPWVLLGLDTGFAVVDVNATTNQLGTLVPFAGSGSAGMVYSNNSLWANVDGVVRIDTTTRQPAKPQPNKWDYLTTLVASNNYLWEPTLAPASEPGHNTLTVLDITGDPRVVVDRAPIPPGDWQSDGNSTADATGLWIPNQNELLHIQIGQ